MTVGERIRIARTGKRATQKEIAKNCNMADSAIRKYESGQITPKYETIDRIANALALPLSFFQSTQPFEDLDFLEQFKSVILKSLENHGFFSMNGRAINDIENYEYWKCIADHIVSIVQTNKNSLSIQYNDPQIPEAEQAKFAIGSATLDFNAVIKPLIEEGHAVTTYRILSNLNRMNTDGQKEAARSVEIIAGNPDYQKEKTPADGD